MTLDLVTGNRFAALTDGEGNFNIRKSSGGRLAWTCEFTIKLRADDLPFLQHMQEAVGLGRIYRNRVKPEPGRNTMPAFQWKTWRKADCIELVDIFYAYPLWSKKRDDFRIWASAVEYWNKPDWQYLRNRRGHRELVIDWTPMEEHSLALKQARQFVLPIELREAVEAVPA